MFENAIGVAAVDWATIVTSNSLAPITDAVETIAPLAVPVMIAVSAVVVGFRILKRFISMAG